LSDKANNETRFQIAREANLRLTGGQVVWGELKNGDNSPKKHWAALCAANQIFTENPKSFFIVQYYKKCSDPPS